MLALYIVLGIIGGLLLIAFFSLLYLHYQVFYSPHKGQNNDFALTKSTQFLGNEDNVTSLISSLKEIPYEDAYIMSFDILKLHARVYKSTNNDKRVAILFHGYRGTACRDFSGGAKLLIEEGLNVILVDERGHGLSKGHNITFGRREQKDVSSWCTYAHQIFGDDIEIILVGISMGAATVLMASDQVDVKKIIADCPYSTEREIIEETIRHLKLSSKIFWPITNLSSIIFSRSNLSKDDASIHVKNSKAKILIIHGEKDSIVPYKFSERIYLENKEKVQYELFANTDHGVSYLTDTNRYKKVVKDFINK